MSGIVFAADGRVVIMFLKQKNIQQKREINKKISQFKAFCYLIGLKE